MHRTDERTTRALAAADRGQPRRTSPQSRSEGGELSQLRSYDPTANLRPARRVQGRGGSGISTRTAVPVRCVARDAASGPAAATATSRLAWGWVTATASAASRARGKGYGVRDAGHRHRPPRGDMTARPRTPSCISPE